MCTDVRLSISEMGAQGLAKGAVGMEMEVGLHKRAQRKRRGELDTCTRRTFWTI